MANAKIRAWLTEIGLLGRKGTKCSFWFFVGWVMLILITLTATIRTVSASDSQNIRVVFRYDDPSATSNFEIEDKLIEIFREYQMPLVWAVIPYRVAEDAHDPSLQKKLPLPYERAELFATAAEEGVLEIALHGYSHQSNDLAENWRPGAMWPSEFAGLSMQDQVLKIQTGKDFLEAKLGLGISIFVPPWNTYDDNTIKALELTGFKNLSACPRLTSPPDPSTTLSFAPATCHPHQIKQAVEEARTVHCENPLIVVLFHEYEFLDVSQSRGLVTLDHFKDKL